MQNKTPQRDPLPENFDSLEEFWAFWDTHSTADYEDLMEDEIFLVNKGGVLVIQSRAVGDIENAVRLERDRRISELVQRGRM